MRAPGGRPCSAEAGDGVSVEDLVEAKPARRVGSACPCPAGQARPVKPLALAARMCTGPVRQALGRFVFEKVDGEQEGCFPEILIILGGLRQRNPARSRLVSRGVASGEPERTVVLDLFVPVPNREEAEVM